MSAPQITKIFRSKIAKKQLTTLRASRYSSITCWIDIDCFLAIFQEKSEMENQQQFHGHQQVKVNDQVVTLQDATPTGEQILHAAALRPTDDFVLLQWLADGSLEEIGPDENADLCGETVSQFFAWASDRLFYFTMDGQKFPWAKDISESWLRKLGRVPDTHAIWIEKQGSADEELTSDSVLDLSQPGVEHLYSKKRSWKLDVQGVIVTFDVPEILVRDAIVRAGIDPDRDWNIVLKVHGQPKQAVDLNTIVDLRTPGIERLRLMPRTINNGEASVAARREFALQPNDEAVLTSLGYHWKTIVAGRRWLIIRNYKLPAGYQQECTDIAIDIPTLYPAAEIDMFYCNPPLTLSSHNSIPQTEWQETIEQTSFQRWSRHRLPGAWKPESDSVLTHLALVEESLLREVGQ
ncbi:multiubiquitin domain-containing protein [Ralstonia mojiangensis]|uniref:multiubiquitin domain-containing protein n=1 Tax=Ralstonia mojiangensis TaxID=2953895 RepID=UPI0021B4CC8C|nr:multiubiquitin domain-containing protein [Ralstonia mojiangensis]MCT7327325.1 multiubiquitin domain-containing protein [Ralstonia mojiangensis]